jgi:hypothetical protein
MADLSAGLMAAPAAELMAG